VQDEVHAGHVVVRRVDAHLAGEVTAEIEIGICRNLVVVLVLHAVDMGADGGELCQEVHAILVHRIPVVHLAHALLVPLHEHGLTLQRHDRRGQQRHRVLVLGHHLQDVDAVLGESAARP
jgi:hypothetical protein